MCEQSFQQAVEALDCTRGAKRRHVQSSKCTHFFPQAHTATDSSLHSAQGALTTGRGRRVHFSAELRPAGAPAAGKEAGRMRSTFAVQGLPAPPSSHREPLMGSRPPQGMWQTESQQKSALVAPEACRKAQGGHAHQHRENVCIQLFSAKPSTSPDGGERALSTPLPRAGWGTPCRRGRGSRHLQAGSRVARLIS